VNRSRRTRRMAAEANAFARECVPNCGGAWLPTGSSLWPPPETSTDEDDTVTCSATPVCTSEWHDGDDAPPSSTTTSATVCETAAAVDACSAMLLPSAVSNQTSSPAATAPVQNARRPVTRACPETSPWPQPSVVNTSAELSLRRNMHRQWRGRTAR